MEDIKNKIDDIYEKHFKSSLFGYKKVAVDSYLDEISEFLELLNKQIQNDKDAYDTILKENLKLKSALVKTEKKLVEANKTHNIDDMVLEKKLTAMEEEIKLLRRKKMTEL